MGEGWEATRWVRAVCGRAARGGAVDGVVDDIARLVSTPALSASSHFMELK